MTAPAHDALVAAATALAAAVTHDDSGTNGVGGNGGLLSRETIRRKDEVLQALHAAKGEDVVPAAAVAPLAQRVLDLAADREELRAVLVELVALKRLKDAAGGRGSHLTPEYMRRQPDAWAAAVAVLERVASTPSHAGQPDA